MTRNPKSMGKGKGRGKGSAKTAAKSPAKAPAKKAARTKAAAKKPAAPTKAAARKAAKAPAKKAARIKATVKKPAEPKFEHVFDNPRNVKRAIYFLFAICGITLVLDFVVRRHVDHPWEGLFGFYAVYGFVACVILVLVAKEMRKVVMRKEDYYDD
ncbi:MAG: hypothetical protein ACE5GT_10965 [Rhodospirillales bacterium]